MAKIEFFSAGYCTHPACIAVRGANWGSCEFPARVFLLHANGQHWLWDTGYSEHFFSATKGIYSLYKWITPVYFSSEQHIVHQLKQHGLSPLDLQGIILSHFHADHIAGIKDFPHVPLMVAHQAWQFLSPLRGIAALKQGFLPDLIPQTIEQQLRFIHSFQLIALPKELEPFRFGWVLPNSNGEIILVELDGHAIGHLGAFVLTEQGWQLIASDAAWSVKNFRDQQVPAKISQLIMYQPSAFYRTLGYLQQLDQRGIKIHLSHDMTNEIK